MATNKNIKQLGASPNENIANSDDSSDVSITDSDSDDNISVNDNISINSEEHKEFNNTNEKSDSEIEEEEEDEVIKAIRKENEKQRDHPQQIICEEYITDISFHPQEDILAVSNVAGDILLYRYSNEENKLVNTYEVHTKSCRAIEFSEDGKTLFSVSKDKCIMLSNTETGQLINFYEDAHDVPLYCINILDNNLFATGNILKYLCLFDFSIINFNSIINHYFPGDDDGEIKLWDSRVKINKKSIFRLKKNEDFISDLITNENQQYLVCSSGDGSLTTIDLRNR